MVNINQRDVRTSTHFKKSTKITFYKTTIMQDKEYELTNAFKMFAYNTLPLNSKYLSLIKGNIQPQINTISLLTNRLEGKS